MISDLQQWRNAIANGHFRFLARAISAVENEVEGHRALLKSLHIGNCPVLGFTGPPGAGKSTLVNALTEELLAAGKRIAVVAVDPSSPFNLGALLGDRIRMAQHFNEDRVYIRSVATRGSLGGLSAKIIEIVDVLKAANFDYIIVETVGVGQSEVEIAGLADITTVILVPESGDEVQTMKSGLMEVADIFVVNKADREGALKFYSNLKKLVHQQAESAWNIPVLQTVANKKEGIPELIQKINAYIKMNIESEKKKFLLSRKALELIKNERVKDIDQQELRQKLARQASQSSFNLYAFLEDYY